MSVSRHHADWLSLVEVSGPFVSLPVLMRIFPQGLEPRDPVQAKSLREAYAEWRHNPTAPGRQRAWVLHVLTAVLRYPQDQITEGQTLPAGLEATMPEMGETLRPDFALVGSTGTDTAGQAQILIASYPADQALGKPVIGKHWKATPTTRMMELLHGAGVPLGLITNGEQWMLVYAPRGETTGYASWYGALWLDEPITLRAFHSLLGVRRFFGVAADNTLLALLRESANDQQEVTDQLGHQVREAVEVLVQSLDALDKESNRTLLKGVSETALYDAALTIMMRLVFLFSAEERDLLHLGKPLYDDNYAVSTLQEQLQEVADHYGEEVLERRYDAWARLLATFRAVHGGIQHQDLMMQAYGGSLFDPDRYPFLEGRAAGTAWRSTIAEPLAVNNRVVLHLLNSLQRLRIKAGAGGAAETRRVSFRALGVEQLGHVYEGLLDHTAVRAAEPVLGIKGTRSKETEISLATLESLRGQRQDKLLEFLKEESGRSASAIRRNLDQGNLDNDHKLLIACGQDESLLDRLRPFVGLIREDSFERPLVVLPGSVYVTVGTTRRSTGTHYTPPSLTEPIVQYTVEPLVYEGPAEGWPREQWKLRSPKAILDLKVCDMTMGSGAFLVQACRYLAERLVEAWENVEKQHPGEVLITPDGTFSEGLPTERLVPADVNERIAIARRAVADRCLYGVDINPMAVEMAKLSLWLITVDRDRPFTFLDHAFKCGDSLLGVRSVKEIENFSLRPDVRQATFATANLSRFVEESSSKRRALEDLPSNDYNQIQTKSYLHAEAEASTAVVKALADCLIALEMRSLDSKIYEEQRTTAADHAEMEMSKPLPEFQAYAREIVCGHRTFHWPLEFPEVFARGGFDAFVGNPPFMGGLRITEVLGVEYNKMLVANTEGANRKADLCCYFLRRVATLVWPGGLIGLIATNSITQGLNKRVALEHICRKGFSIYRAWSSLRWPGPGAVEVSIIHSVNGGWQGSRFLDGNLVNEISSSLTSKIAIPATVLLENEGKSYVGPFVYGDGFLLTKEEYEYLISECSDNKNVILPYLIGQDINSHPHHYASRFVISFEERTEGEAQKYALPFARLRRDVFPFRDAKTPPQRDMRLKTQWWKFFHPRLELIEAMKRCEEICVRSQVSTHHAVAIVSSKLIPSHFVTCFLGPVHLVFPVIQSALHEEWVWATASSLGGYNNTRYIQRDCFMTFPFPKNFWSEPDIFKAIAVVGRNYHAFRKQILLSRNEGLTKIYNRFHDQDEKSEDIAQLRALHAEMDKTVAAAYDWSDLGSDHDFYSTKRGVRYAISETARHKVLDRLLALNHRRHAEGEAERLAQRNRVHAKTGRKKKDEKRDFSDQLAMEPL